MWTNWLFCTCYSWLFLDPCWALRRSCSCSLVCSRLFSLCSSVSEPCVCQYCFCSHMSCCLCVSVALSHYYVAQSRQGCIERRGHAMLNASHVDSEIFIVTKNSTFPLSIIFVANRYNYNGNWHHVIVSHQFSTMVDQTEEQCTTPRPLKHRKIAAPSPLPLSITACQLFC